MPNSSNSNRLRELAEKQGRVSYLIDGPGDINPEWLHGVDVIGVTAGASAPEVVVSDVIQRLQSLGAEPAEDNMGVREDIVFVLPKNLRLLAEKLASRETG